MESRKKSVIDTNSLIAGLASGGLTNLLLHPLDSLKTRLQGIFSIKRISG
jgi:hypothetical protein